MNMNDLPEPMTDRPRPGPNWGGSAARACSLVADLMRRRACTMALTGRIVDGYDGALRSLRNNPQPEADSARIDDVNGSHRLVRLLGPGEGRSPNSGDKDTGCEGTHPVSDLDVKNGRELASTAGYVRPVAIRGLAHYHAKMGAKHNRQQVADRGGSDRRAGLRARPGACLSPRPNRSVSPRGSSPLLTPGICEVGRCGVFDIGSWWRVAEALPLVDLPEASGHDRSDRRQGLLDPRAELGASTISCGGGFA
jgi:hypothetical protein